MTCPECGAAARWNCGHCNSAVWCSVDCCLRQANVHDGCEMDPIGVRAGTRVKGLLGKLDFANTLPALFKALLNLHELSAVHMDEVIKTDKFNLESACKTGKAYSDSLCEVDTRLKEIKKMLNAISSKIAPALARNKAKLFEALDYDVDRAARMALQPSQFPLDVESMSEKDTFETSFAWLEEFVEADAATKKLARTPPTAPLSDRYLAILINPTGRVRAEKVFMDQLKAWGKALDASFKRIKKA